MGNYLILLADDHALVRQGLRRIIEGAAGLEVIGEAGDGIGLLSLLDGLVPDMVILDISMPKLRGIEAIVEIKKKRHDVKVLVLTMHKEYLHQALSKGADGYLLKEDADRELFSAIESIREGKVCLSPRLTGELLRGRVPSSEKLSIREKQVLQLIAAGKASKEIAEILCISVRTVESHRSSIHNKLSLKNTADLIKYALQKGLT